MPRVGRNRSVPIPCAPRGNDGGGDRAQSLGMKRKKSRKGARQLTFARREKGGQGRSPGRRVYRAAALASTVARVDRFRQCTSIDDPLNA